MRDLLTTINMGALLGLLILVAIGVYFWIFGERTEVHEEEKFSSRPRESMPEKSNTSEYE